HAGEARQHVAGGLLGIVEFPGLDESEHGTGRVVQLVAAVVAEVRMRGGSGRRAGGRLVVGHAAALVFLAAAAWAGIIPSDFGHLAKVSSKDGSLNRNCLGYRSDGAGEAQFGDL